MRSAVSHLCLIWGGVPGKIARGAETVYRAVISIAVWGIIVAGGYLLFPIVSPYLLRPDVLAIILVVMASAIITLWRETARRPPRPNKKFLNELLHSEPITPQHNPWKIAGGRLSSFATDDYRRFFADFAAFADVVNWWLADEYIGNRWRLQELPDGDVRLNVDFSDGPTLGRCYALFYNEVELGRLEIRPGYPDDAAIPEVITEVELHSVRLLSYDTIADFLSAIAMYTCDSNSKDGKSTNPNQAIADALNRALWQSQRITEFADLDGQDWGELSLHLHGLATPFYFKRREALQKKRVEQGRQ
jgi:hypothetical protein